MGPTEGCWGSRRDPRDGFEPGPRPQGAVMGGRAKVRTEGPSVRMTPGGQRKVTQ